MTKPKFVAADRKTVVEHIKRALAECNTINIRLEGSTGRVTISVGHNNIARYSDAYEAIDILLPALSRELA